MGAEAALDWRAPWASRKFTARTSSGRALELLGDQQSFYLLEQYVPGDIYHVDAIFYERELLFAIASRYGRPPMEVSQQGDIFTTAHTAAGFAGTRELIEMNAKVMKAFGMVRGVSHSEFIRGRTMASCIFWRRRRAWAERTSSIWWKRLPESTCGRSGRRSRSPAAKRRTSRRRRRNDSAGLLVSLAKQETPDTSAYNDPEIVWRMNEKKHHVGLIVKSPRSAARRRNCCTATSSACGRIFWRGSRRWTGPIF